MGAPTLATSELHLAAQSIVEQLRRESDYLDNVIQCSLTMKDLLLRSRHSLDSDEQLATMREELARQFVPVHEGRQQMQLTLQQFDGASDAPPTLRQLAPKLDTPVRDEMLQLRLTIKSKLQEIQAIAMGNQAVLIYTLDFYHRLMSGITGDTPSAQAYNAMGQMTNQGANRIVETDA